MKQAVRINEDDNVFVALTDLSPGTLIDEVRVTEAIPAGHKFAARSIESGAPVVKYSYPIGIASQAIGEGAHVHSHNVRSVLSDKAAIELRSPGRSGTAPGQPVTFQGYRRADGRVGIRNDIWILPTVGCVNNIAERIAQAANAELVSERSGIDSVVAFPHPYGCSQLGHDLDNTRRFLSALMHHPNAGGILIIGLGCENNQLSGLLSEAGITDTSRVLSFNAQQVDNELEVGLAKVRTLAETVRKAQRTEISADELVIGMKCGGSDGLSGITANPLVGRVSDHLTRMGGSVLLTEVPEMFGAEQALFGRAKDQRVAQQAVNLVNEFRDYFRRYGEPIDENPSPGNKEGGITTLAEKSLGCVQKGGVSTIVQVLDYAEPAPAKMGGLGLVKAPGNDGVSGAALVAAGAHMVLFTTGRGTPMGFPAPTLKISTNTALATRKPGWIDFDAGSLAEGTSSFEELTPQLFQLILDVASGKVRAKNELHGFREIAIWKDGVTL